MMKPQLIAAGISNLDEARYFSAMGVDWIGFDMDRISADAVNAITAWIVGPKFFAEFTAAQDDMVFEIVHKTGVQGICLPVSADIPSWYQGSVIIDASVTESDTPFPNGSILLIPSDSGLDHQSLTGLSAHHTCWLEIDPDHTTADQLRNINAHGIVIRCVESDPDGYERYDHFFEVISLSVKRG